MTQPDLFDVGERIKLPPKRCSPATADTIGSGPAGETCGSCQHYTRVHYQAGVYRKCGLMEKHWTHGAGTDIKARWPACSKWEERQPSEGKAS